MENVNQQITVSLFDNVKDNMPREESMTQADFVQLFQQRDIREKKDGPAWAPVTFAKGTTRANSNVSSMTVVPLDFDSQDWKKVKAMLKQKGWRSFAHSTFSHSNGNSCFRVVVFISRPLTPPEISPVRKAVIEALGGGVDAKTSDLARVYHLPSCPAASAGDAFFYEIEGKELDVDDLLRGGKRARQRSSTKKTADSNGRINRRAIADDVLKKFESALWFSQGHMRYYEDGWWPTLSDDELIKFVLTEYDGTVREDAEAVIKTLAGLCHHEVEQTEESQRLICMTNGTLDPVTMELHSHAPEHRLTYALPFPWDPEAKAPQFLQFLKDVWENEVDYEDRVRCIGEFGGQIFLPSNRYGHFVWLLGQGANGKSVLSRVFEHLVGKDNVSHVALERLSKPASRAHIAQKLLNVSSEIGAEATLADGYLKAMVTGDAVDAEPKYKVVGVNYPGRPATTILAGGGGD